MKRLVPLLILILVLSSIPVWAVPMASETEGTVVTAMLKPTDDAYVKDSEPNSNFGDYYLMFVGTYYRDRSNERAYLKFNLSSIPDNAVILSAELYAYTYKGAYATPINVSAYAVSDDSWNEDTITWNNKPPAGEFLDRDFVDVVGRHWSIWNVTDFVREQFSTDKVVSFVLISDSEGAVTESIGYNSKESSYVDERPYLKVVYLIPPKTVKVGNSTVAVFGDANVSDKDGQVAVNVDGNEYVFPPVTTTLYVDSRDFNLATPVLLAYWDASLTGYEITEKSYIAEQTLEKTVRVTEKTVTAHLNMGDPSMAVLVVPKLGDKVKSVVVLKDTGEVELQENDIANDLGYYYLTSNSLVIVLKRDPTDVIVTFESLWISTRPPAFDTFYKLSLHYLLYMKGHTDELDAKYSEFQNLTSQLEEYNVDLSSVPVSEIQGDMQRYRNLTSHLPLNIGNLTTYRFKLYVLFVKSREAFLLQRELIKELDQWNPILEASLEKARELAQQQANQTGETNQTTNQTEIVVPSVNETQEVKVLIDYSHDQYYVGQGVQGLTTRIFKELGWKVTINTKPLSYDLLKDYKVVILLNPKISLSENEIEALQKYVENGGGLLIAGDWYKYVNLESINAVVEKYGIKFNADELMDDDRNSGKRYYPYVGVYNKEHPVMHYVPDTWVMYYNGDTLTVSGDAVWLIRAFGTGYAVDANGNIIQGKGSGPIVAAAVEVGNGRIVAYGSSRAFSDVYYSKYIKSNWPFIKGALLWLAHQE